MSRPFSDPDTAGGEQPDLGFSSEHRRADEQAPAPLERRAGAGRSDRTGEPARRDFFRAKRRPVLPVLGLCGAVATVAFFLWLGRDEAALPDAPPTEELAPVAAAPAFEVPFPEAGPAAPNPEPLAAAQEPDPSIAPPAPSPAEVHPRAETAPAQAAALSAPTRVAVPKPAAAAARTPAGARTAYSVQLLAARSEADVGASWEKLRGAYPDLLASLSPTVARTDRAPGDTFYRLRAGPLPDRAAADALCRALSARQQSCFVVSPGS